MRPVAWRRARSRRSCSSLSSKSSRSSVAACSISRTLVALVKRSESSESSSDTTRPSTSDSTASPNSSASSHSMRFEPAAGEPLAQVVARVRRLREQHDLVDDQLADVERRHRQQRARSRRSAACASISAGLVCQTSRRNGGRLRRRRSARAGCVARRGRRARPRSPSGCGRPSSNCGAWRYCAS